MRVLIVANDSIESEEVRDAIVGRAAGGRVHVTLVAPAAVGAGPLCAPLTAAAKARERARDREAAQRVDRAVRQLREAGVVVEGSVGGAPGVSEVDDGWDPSSFDEVVVSCRPWLSFTKDVVSQA